jgi:hypothetical protein
VLRFGYNLRSPIVNLIVPGRVTDSEDKYDQLHCLRNSHPQHKTRSNRQSTQLLAAEN